jgi:hypothetical protein
LPGFQPAWLDRGTFDLVALPTAARSDGDRQGDGFGRRARARVGLDAVLEVVAIAFSTRGSVCLVLS